jgi:hypothetical protein
LWLIDTQTAVLIMSGSSVRLSAWVVDSAEKKDYLPMQSSAVSVVWLVLPGF